MPLTFISYYIYTTSTNDKDEKQMARKMMFFTQTTKSLLFLYCKRYEDTYIQYQQIG